jgi:hypothetical protein
MIKGNLLSILVILLIFSFATESLAQKKKKKGVQTSEEPESKPKSKNGIKPYDEVITKEAKSDEGLFTVHKVDEKYYFEIPDSLLEREMLMVTRIAKTASGIGFGGGKSNTQVLRWQKKGFTARP